MSIEGKATDVLTNDEKSLHNDITDHGRAIRVDETSIVRDNDSHIERSNED